MSGARSDGHGLSAREQQIIDLFEAETPINVIATKLGLAERYVAKVTTFYSGSWRENVRFEAMVRAGSVALAKACIASGGQFR